MFAEISSLHSLSSSVSTLGPAAAGIGIVVVLSVIAAVTLVKFAEPRSTHHLLRRVVCTVALLGYGVFVENSSPATRPAPASSLHPKLQKINLVSQAQLLNGVAELPGQDATSRHILEETAGSRGQQLPGLKRMVGEPKGQRNEARLPQNSPFHRPQVRGFDKVYFINMEQSVDRRYDLLHELQQVASSVPFERWNSSVQTIRQETQTAAVNGPLSSWIKPDRLKQLLTRYTEKQLLAKLSLRNSFTALFQHIQRSCSHEQMFLVVEDDVVLASSLLQGGWSNLSALVNTVPNNWDLLRFNCLHNPQMHSSFLLPTRSDDLIHLAPESSRQRCSGPCCEAFCGGTFSMAVRCSGVDRVLENIKLHPEVVNIDCVLGAPRAIGFQSYCMRTELIGHAPLFGKTKSGRKCRLAPSIINVDNHGEYADENGKKGKIPVCTHDSNNTNIVLQRGMRTMLLQPRASTFRKNCHKVGTYS